jgi:hypothetical protein
MNFDFETDSQQRQGGGEAAYAAAGDDNFGASGHRLGPEGRRSSFLKKRSKKLLFVSDSLLGSLFGERLMPPGCGELPHFSGLARMSDRKSRRLHGGRLVR